MNFQIYRVKIRERIRKLRIWEERVSFEGRGFLGYIVYGSAPNFNSCQVFNSIIFYKIYISIFG